MDRIVSKITRKIGALWRARRSLSRSARRLFVQAVVIPDIVYGCNAFFPALLGRQLDHLDHLGLLQNRAIQAIDGHPPYTTVHPLLVQHGLYRISELSKRKLLVFVWRCLHRKASATLSVLFVRSAGRRTRHQRSSGLLSQPSSTRSGASRPSVAGSALWNLLPDEVRTIARQKQFSISCLPYCCSDYPPPPPPLALLHHPVTPDTRLTPLSDTSSFVIF